MATLPKDVIDALKKRILGCILSTNRRHVAINLAISEERYDDICYGFLRAEEKKGDNEYASQYRAGMSIFCFVLMVAGTFLQKPEAAGTFAVTGTVWSLMAAPSHRNSILYDNLVKKCHEAIEHWDGRPETLDPDLAKDLDNCTLSTDVLFKLLQKFEDAGIPAPTLNAKIDEHLQNPNYSEPIIKAWLEKLFGIDRSISIEEWRKQGIKKTE